MTIAQQLKIKEFPFIIKDSNGNEIYYEDAKGYWVKREYNSQNDHVYSENSNRDWVKNEYDSNGKHVYFESSGGVIIDKRPKSEIQKAIELLTKEGLLVDGKILR
jgi:hypothetical protein